MNKEEQHIEIREKLLKLPRVKVREGFENKLLNRINLLDTGAAKSPATKSSFWDSLFGKRSLAWTIPATSLAVIAIIFVGVYFAFYNSKDMKNISEDKSLSNQQSGVESLKINPLTQESAKNEIPGKDIANDFDIGKSPKVERMPDLGKGLNETFAEPSPKPVPPSKINVIDSKKESTIYEKADDIGKTGKTIKPPDEKESGVSKGVLKEDKKTEESNRSKEPEKKITIPLLKDGDKVKSEKGNDKEKDKDEAKKKDEAKNKEEAKKKNEAKNKEERKNKEEAKSKEEIKSKEETKNKEEARKKEESKRKEEEKRKEEAKRKETKELNKEELEKLKEKIKDN